MSYNLHPLFRAHLPINNSSGPACMIRKKSYYLPFVQ